MIEPRNFVSDLSVDKVLAVLACTRIALTGILEAPTNDFAMYYVCHVIDWCDHFNTLVTQIIVKFSYIDRRFVVRGGCDCNEPSPITHHHRFLRRHCGERPYHDYASFQYRLVVPPVVVVAVGGGGGD